MRTCSLNGDSVSEIGKVKTGKICSFKQRTYYMNKEDGKLSVPKIECNGNNQRITSAAITDLPDVTENGIYWYPAEDEQNHSNRTLLLRIAHQLATERTNLYPAIITQGRINAISRY